MESMKKQKKSRLSTILKVIFGLGLLGLVGLLGLNMLVISSTQDKILTLEEATNSDVDCILVLGAGVGANGVPSPILRDRLDKGIELYQAQVSNRLLMSGDHGQVDYDEVNVMKNYAISSGITSSDIFMDHAGFSTYESLYRAKFVFQVEKVLIVSQKEHLYRAIYIAESLGMDAIGVAAEDIHYGGDEARDLREFLARIKDVFSLIIQPNPTYLGDPIPIDGDGNSTND
jgi:SanA protein